MFPIQKDRDFGSRSICSAHSNREFELRLNGSVQMNESSESPLISPIKIKRIDRRAVDLSPSTLKPDKKMKSDYYYAWSSRCSVRMYRGMIVSSSRAQNQPN